MAQARLYLDEDVLPSLAELLRARGFDVVSAHEQGRQGLTDEEHLAYTTQQGRVLVSYDRRDYGHLAQRWFESGREHGGIVLGHRQFARTRIGVAATAFVRLLNTVTAEEMRNAVRYIEEFLP